MESIARHGAACNGHICGGKELNALAVRLAGASGRVNPATIARFEEVIRKAAGASTQNTAAVQVVEGPVIKESPGKASAPEQVARAGAAPSPGTKSDEPVAKSEAGPPPAEVAREDGAKRNAKEGTLITLALVACGLAFLIGVVRRSTRHRVGPE